MEPITSNVPDCALVLEGGGYRASYSSGIVNVLLEQGIHFDYVCGISAGSSCAVNYVSRDQRRVHDSFMMSEKMKEHAGLRSLVHGTGYFDADFLYEGALTDGTLPFDWETFCANPARIRVQAFERDTGRTVRFGREDMTDPVRMVNLVRASSTLPGAMHPLPMDGRVLYDGGLGAGGGIPIGMAEDDGEKRFFFVATRPRGYRKKAPSNSEHRMYQHIARDYPYLRNALLTRWERYNEALDHVDELVAEGRAFVVWPDEMPVENSTVNSKRLEASYEAGHAQGLRDIGKWRKFLFGARDGGPEATDTGTGYITLG